MINKRIVALVTALLLCCGTAGCQGNTTNSSQIEEPTQLHIVYSSYAGIPQDLELVQEALSKLTLSKINCTVNLEVYPSSSYDTQINLLLSGSDKIDLMTSGLNTRYEQVVVKKMIQPLDALLQTHGQGIVDAVGSSLEASRIGGALYGVTGMPFAGAADTGFAVKNSIIKELDIDLPAVRTVQDVEKVLRKIKSAYPDSTPLVPSSAGRAYDDFYNLALRQNNMELLGDGCVLDYNTMKICNVYETPMFREVVQMLYQWNREGLIMSNSATNSDARSTLLQGNVGVAYLTTSFSPTLTAKENKQLDVTAIELEQNAILSTSSFTNTQWMVPVSSENPEKAIRFLNLLYTDPEIGNLLQYGIEGQHYVLTDTPGLIAYPSGQNASNSRYYVKSPGITDINPQCYAIEPLPVDIYKQLLTFKDSFSLSPVLGFVADTSSCKTEVASIANVIAQYHFSMVAGDLDPSILDTVNQKLAGAGIAEVIKTKQTQLDRWLQSRTNTTAK